MRSEVLSSLESITTGICLNNSLSLRTDHAFILYEQRDPAADLSDIRLLNSWPGGGIVLITSRELTERERREYLRAGVNSAIAGDMPRKDFLRTLPPSRCPPRRTSCLRPFPRSGPCGCLCL